MTPTYLIEILIRALPYPDQIRDIEIEQTAVRFKWRSQHFRVSVTAPFFAVEIVDGNVVLQGHDVSILLSELLKRTYGRMLAESTAAAAA